jgi:hypothetical protein
LLPGIVRDSVKVWMTATGGIGMRGADRRTGELFSYVDLESWVRTDHPLWKIREVVNATLLAMQADFAEVYSRLGRPGVDLSKPKEGGPIENLLPEGAAADTADSKRGG